MNRSEKIGELAKALAKAQAGVRPAVKDSENPFLKTRYADFASVLDACENALAQNGLAIVQSPITNDHGAGVETLLLHGSGEWISDTLILPVNKRDAQGVGSCITYARRYALEGFMRIKREEDDGHAASVSANNQERKQESSAKTSESINANAKAVQAWAQWLETKPNLEAVNETIGDLSHEAEVVKKQAWALIKGYAKERGWQFDAASKAFFAPANQIDDDVRKLISEANAQHGLTPNGEIADVFARCRQFEAALVKRRTCKPGELMDYLLDQLGDMTDSWNADDAEQACETFRTERVRKS